MARTLGYAQGVTAAGLPRKAPMSDLKNFLLPNAPTCIAACTQAEARLWRSISRFGDWELTATLQHPEAAYGEQQLVSDRPGRAFDSFGSGRHAMAPQETAQDHELRRFAKQVAAHLNKAIAANTYVHIVLVSEPRFLGCLRPELSNPAAQAVLLEVPLNPANLDENQLRAYFSS